MVLDLEQFVKKVDKIIRRNRTVYDFLESLAIALVLLLVFVFFNLSEVFKYISITEPYFGLYPNIPLFTVKYETIFAFFIAFLLALLIMELFERNKKAVYKRLNKRSPGRDKPADIVERTYPELKDRLKTAYDNRADNTIVAADLNKSVTHDVTAVTTAGLLDKKRLAYSMATIILSVLFLSAIFVTGITSPLTPGDILDRPPNEIITQPPPTPDAGNNSSSNPPTETPPIASTPGIDIDITLPPGAGAGPGDLLEDSTNNTFSPSEYYPPESLSSIHYYEYLPEGYEDIIKDYFEKLAEQN